MSRIVAFTLEDQLYRYLEELRHTLECEIWYALLIG
jgi:hypothetical protein